MKDQSGAVLPRRRGNRHANRYGHCLYGHHNAAMSCRICIPSFVGLCVGSIIYLLLDIRRKIPLVGCLQYLNSPIRVSNYPTKKRRSTVTPHWFFIGSKHRVTFVVSRQKPGPPAEVGVQVISRLNGAGSVIIASVEIAAHSGVKQRISERPVATIQYGRTLGGL